MHVCVIFSKQLDDAENTIQILIQKLESVEKNHERCTTTGNLRLVSCVNFNLNEKCFKSFCELKLLLLNEIKTIFIIPNCLHYGTAIYLYVELREMFSISNIESCRKTACKGGSNIY